MIFMPVSTYPVKSLNSVLDVLVGAFKQKKALLRGLLCDCDNFAEGSCTALLPNGPLLTIRPPHRMASGQVSVTVTGQSLITVLLTTLAITLFCPRVPITSP